LHQFLPQGRHALQQRFEALQKGLPALFRFLHQGQQVLELAQQFPPVSLEGLFLLQVHQLLPGNGDAFPQPGHVTGGALAELSEFRNASGEALDGQSLVVEGGLQILGPGLQHDEQVAVGGILDLVAFDFAGNVGPYRLPARQSAFHSRQFGTFTLERVCEELIRVLRGVRGRGRFRGLGPGLCRPRQEDPKQYAQQEEKPCGAVS
jgi:hypothetical protein